MLAMLVGPLTPSTIEIVQKVLFFFIANDRASRSRSRNCFLRLSRRISYLYLFFARLLMVKRTP